MVDIKHRQTKEDSERQKEESTPAQEQTKKTMYRPINKILTYNSQIF